MKEPKDIWYPNIQQSYDTSLSTLWYGNGDYWLYFPKASSYDSSQDSLSSPGQDLEVSQLVLSCLYSRAFEEWEPTFIEKNVKSFLTKNGDKSPLWSGNVFIFNGTHYQTKKVWKLARPLFLFPGEALYLEAGQSAYLDQTDSTDSSTSSIALHGKRLDDSPVIWNVSGEVVSGFHKKTFKNNHNIPILIESISFYSNSLNFWYLYVELSNGIRFSPSIRCIDPLMNNSVYLPSQQAFSVRPVDFSGKLTLNKGDGFSLEIQAYAFMIGSQCYHVLLESYWRN